MNNMNLLKEETAFHKLFLLFRKKYESLGHIGGTVKLKGFSEEEIKVISGLTGYPEDKLQTKQTISLMKFEQALQSTKYRDYTLLELLETFFNEKLLSKKESKKQESEKERKFLTYLAAQYPSISWYIDWLSGKTTDCRWVWALYAGDEEQLALYIQTMEQAFRQLQQIDSFERVPLFAQRLTGNPHALDRNKVLGKMLLHMLTVHQNLNGIKTEFTRGTSDENELLGNYGLLRDDLWSFVTSQNLLAKMSNDMHPVWKAAKETHTVLNTPIKELIKIDKIYPATGRNVWVVENSSIASTLMDRIPNAPILCTHGQFRLAGWRVIKLLVESDTQIYYSGDLDPEGVQIADRLKRKYGKAISIWRMDEETYLHNHSGDILSSERMNKLNNLLDDGLLKVAELMRKHQKALYQEAIIDLMVDDIERLF